MDLTKEFKTMQNDGNSKNIVAQLREKQIEIEKKIFIVQIVDMANYAQKLYEEKVFQENKIHLFEVSWNFEDGVGNAFDYRFKDEANENIIYLTVKNANKLSPMLNCLTSLMGFNDDFLSEGFNHYQKNLLEINKNIKEKILNLFLSEELKKIVEYNELELNIDKKEQLTKQRSKI
jgi:hypothetical protein